MAKQTVSEEEIQLRKRARRRLVGAIALAILAAIFLPMVFDDQAKPVGNVQIQIPDEKTASPFQPEIQPASAPAPVSAPVAAVQKPQEPVVQKPAQPDSPAKETKKPVSQTYVIQLGVFSNAANVKDLRAKLSASGIKTYVESVGSKTRVRAGPYASRAAADAAHRKIAKLGLDGVVEAK